MIRKQGIYGIICLIALISLYIVYQFQPRSFLDVTGINSRNINRIYIFSGSTGQGFSTKDKKYINQCIQLLEQRSYSFRKDQWNITMGYSNYVDLYQDDKKLSRMLFQGSKVSIDSLMYTMDKDVSGKIYELSKELSEEKKYN